MRPNFSNETRNDIIAAQHGMCDCKDCYEPIADFHHIKRNSKTNQGRWPLFLQSPFNCRGICRACHDGPEMYQFRISDTVAMIYEKYLRNLIEKGPKYLQDPNDWKMGTGQGG